MRRAVIALALALAFGPRPAAALSCLAMTPQDVFHVHDDAEATFVAVLGSFGPLKQVRHDGARDRVIWRATVRGHTASGRGFDQPFAAEVEVIQPLWSAVAGGGVDHAYLGIWLPGLTGIVYLERRGAGYRLTGDICRGMIDTDPASIRPTLLCLTGRRCPRSN